MKKNEIAKASKRRTSRATKRPLYPKNVITKWYSPSYHNNLNYDQ